MNVSHRVLYAGCFLFVICKFVD